MSLLRSLFLKSPWRCTLSSKIVVQQKLPISSNTCPESLYISEKVQELLKKITGFDLDRILKAKPIAEPEPPKYKLITDDQLKQLQDEAIVSAQKYMQMPPYMKARDFVASKILSDDTEIAMFERDTSSYVFTDISAGPTIRERDVVIREKSGVLRLADQKERDRMMWVYYPGPEKMYKMPKMFEEETLETLLGPKYYKYILDRAGWQFEPDDQNYVRVTHRVYEHIRSTKSFDLFRSNRHFGPMSFYFLLHNKIDSLLSDMLTRDLTQDAVNLIQLYCLVHPESKTNAELSASGYDDPSLVLQTYLKHNSVDKVELELALTAHAARNAPEEQASAHS